MISRERLPELLMNAWAGSIVGIAAILAVGIFFCSQQTKRLMVPVWPPVSLLPVQPQLPGVPYRR